MNRPVWSFRSSVSGCELIEPLLPPYADGAASPAEIRLVETHLPDCADCRASLSWIRATHAALASRPVAVPPPELHSRIALAIAAASAAPVRLRPARVFSLRPAYAAAASLTALGVVLGVGYSVWHGPAQVAVKPAARPKANTVATVPPPAVTKTPALPTIKRHALVASHVVKPVAVKHPVIAREIVPVRETPPEQVALSRVPETKLVVKTPAAKTPVHQLVPGKLIATKKIKESKHTVTLPEPKHEIVASKTPDAPRVANVPKEPVSVPVRIQPPTVHVDPPLQTASSVTLGSKSDNGLGMVNAFAAKLRNASYSASGFTARRSSPGGASLIHTADNDHTAYVAGVYTP